MRWWIFSSMIVAGSLSFAQSAKTGRLVDADTGEPVPQAHVRNLSQSKGTVSTFQGIFELPMVKDDSLWITSVGYENLGIIITSEWDSLSSFEIEMTPGTIMLEELVVSHLPSESVFKQRILDYQPSDSILEIHGVERTATYDNPMLQNQHVKSLGFALSHPFSFAYRNLSKKEKEKRKMYRIEKNQLKRFEILQKYNRDYVHHLTGLNGDELINFILYCDFSEDYLAKASQYEIAETIMVKYLEFKKERKG